jgi:hypothetical protein
MTPQTQTRTEPGTRVERNRPWRYHGKPDTCAVRHRGKVIAGHYDTLGYLTVLWDAGPPTAVHPWDVHPL